MDNDCVRFFKYHDSGCKYYCNEINGFVNIPGWKEYEVVFLDFLNGKISTTVDYTKELYILLKNPLISEDSLIELVENMKNRIKNEKNPLVKMGLLTAIDNIIYDSIPNPNVTDRFLDKFVERFHPNMILNKNCEYLLLGNDTWLRRAINCGELKYFGCFSESFYLNCKRILRRERGITSLINFSNPNLSLEFYKNNFFPLRDYNIVTNFLSNIYSDEILIYFLENKCYILDGGQEIDGDIILDNSLISPAAVRFAFKHFSLDDINIDSESSCNIDSDMFLELADNTDDENISILAISVKKPDNRVIEYLNTRTERIQFDKYEYYREILSTILGITGNWQKYLERLDMFLPNFGVFNNLPYWVNEAMINKDRMHRELLSRGENGESNKKSIRGINKGDTISSQGLDGLLPAIRNVSPRFLRANFDYLCRDNLVNLFENKFTLDKNVARSNFDRIKRNIDMSNVNSVLYRPGNLGFQLAKTDFEKNL